MPEASVRETEGGLLMGRDAISAGLADEIGGYDDAIAYFDQIIAGGTGQEIQIRAVSRNQLTSGKNDTISRADHEAKIKAANDGAIDLAMQAESKAIADSKERIKAILTSEMAKGRGDLAAYLAYDTEMAPEQAFTMLEKAPIAVAAPVEASQKLRLAFLRPAVRPERGMNGSASWSSIADEINRQYASTRIGFKAPF